MNVVITGASKGIGNAIAHAFAARHHNLFLCSRTATRLYKAVEDLYNRYPDIKIKALPVDLSTREGCEEFARFVLNGETSVDILVNNAGNFVPGSVYNEPAGQLEQMIGDNLYSAYHLTRALVGKMIEQKSGQIITISSVSAYTASVSRGDYCVSKAGLSMMTKLFAARLAEYGIGVYEIRPGIIATDMTAGVKEKYDALIAKGLSPIARWGTPEDIGKAVAAIATRAFPFSTGEVFNVDGGFHLRIL